MQNSPLLVAHCPPWMDAEARQDMLQAIAALDCRGLVVPEDVQIQVVHAMPEIAAAAYQVYRSAFPDAEVLMPEFAELPTLVKDAWEAVAAKILTYAPAISKSHFSSNEEIAMTTTIEEREALFWMDRLEDS